VKERSISVTEASRNFAECINRVRYQGLSFLLVKNGTAVARLVPATGTVHAVIEGKSEPERAVLPVVEEPRPAQLAADSGAALNSASILDRSLQW